MSVGLHLPDLAARLWADRAPREDLVTRVCDALRSHIASHGTPTGTRLPSEAVLAKELRISRPTLREATRVLAREGLIDIRHGVGTFVAGRSPPLKTALDSMSSLTATIRSSGGVPGVRALSIEPVEPPHEVAEALRLRPGLSAARIERVRLVDGRPFGIASEYLPLDVPGLAALRAFDGSSLYGFLTRDLGIKLMHSAMSVTAVSASPQQARCLAVKPGAPLLLMREIHFGEDDRRVLYSVNYHNSAVIDLTLERAGVRI